jgi:hypothetical protein
MQEQVIRQVFNCPGTQRVVKHQHIVKHCHDTINEYEIIHEHEYNTRDVVREREVVKNNDYCNHVPNYCGETCGCGTCENCCAMAAPMPYRGRGHFGRRW